jgi:hypothetical protein
MGCYRQQPASGYRRSLRVARNPPEGNPIQRPEPDLKDRSSSQPEKQMRMIASFIFTTWVGKLKAALGPLVRNDGISQSAAAAYRGQFPGTDSEAGTGAIEQGDPPLSDRSASGVWMLYPIFFRCAAFLAGDKRGAR